MVVKKVSQSQKKLEHGHGMNYAPCMFIRMRACMLTPSTYISVWMHSVLHIDKIRTDRNRHAKK